MKKMEMIIVLKFYLKGNKIMQNKKLKNTIVLKGMASNIVEEAIVVLKPNVKLKQKEFVEKNNYIERSNFNNIYIVKEAENVILNYVERIKNKNNIDKNFRKLKKYRYLQVSNIVLIISLILTIILK